MDRDELSKLRAEIDAIDADILNLVAARMKLVLKVGRLKQAHGVRVYDAERERAVLERLSNSAPEPLKPDVARRIFERIIDESRSQEKHHVDET